MDVVCAVPAVVCVLTNNGKKTMFLCGNFFVFMNEKSPHRNIGKQKKYCYFLIENFTQPKIRKIEKNNIIFADISYPVSAELISNYKKNA